LNQASWATKIFLNDCARPIADEDFTTRNQSLPADKSFPCEVINLIQEKELYISAARKLATSQASRYHARLINDEGVTRSEVFVKISEAPVFCQIGGTVEDK
jgi:hypothetical protein